MCKNEELKTLLAAARRRNSLGDVKGTCNLLIDALELLISKKDGCCGTPEVAEEQAKPTPKVEVVIDAKTVQSAADIGINAVKEVTSAVESFLAEDTNTPKDVVETELTAPPTEEPTPTVEPVAEAPVEEAAATAPDAVIRQRHRQPKV